MRPHHDCANPQGELPTCRQGCDFQLRKGELNSKVQKQRAVPLDDGATGNEVKLNVLPVFETPKKLSPPPKIRVNVVLLISRTSNLKKGSPVAKFTCFYSTTETARQGFTSTSQMNGAPHFIFHKLPCPLLDRIEFPEKDHDRRAVIRQSN